MTTSNDQQILLDTQLDQISTKDGARPVADTKQRSDRYGGNIEHRIQFAVEVVKISV